MKKMTFLACTAVLASAVALTGCKGDDQNVPQQKAPSVTTDITISLPQQAVGGVRRMPGATVQINPATQFQGITSIKLVPFAEAAAIAAGNNRLGANINLGAITATSELAEVSKAKKYTNVSVPVGTSSFLFYGESANDNADFFQRGKLTGDCSANTPGGFNFILSPIHANATDVTGDAAYTNLLAYLNSVLDATDGTKAWKQYAAPGDDQTFVDLLTAYKSLRTLSSAGIARMMNDLYETLALMSNSTLVTNMKAAIANTEDYVEFDAGATPKITLKTALTNFPASLNIPEGAVALAFDNDSKQFITSASQSYSNEFSVPALTDYTYPASLWYYANTQIATSNESENDALSSTTMNWAEVLAAYTTANGTVGVSTRSVALQGVINYGVARLDVMLKAAETLADNTSPTPVNITNAQGYQLTGVLVSNQKKLGFDFTPESFVGENHAYIIYDTVMTSVIKAGVGDYSAANSTLVVATPLQDATPEDVYVAIELLNNSGQDFMGATGLVPAGSKFYLVGKLESDNANVQESSETVNPGKRVFYPDYTTTARLTITNLKKAYNTIPDLRTPALELGLSVDLSWQNGKVYDIDL